MPVQIQNEHKNTTHMHIILGRRTFSRNARGKRFHAIHCVPICFYIRMHVLYFTRIFVRNNIVDYSEPCCDVVRIQQYASSEYFYFLHVRDDCHNRILRNGEPYGTRTSFIVHHMYVHTSSGVPCMDHKIYFLQLLCKYCITNHGVQPDR